MQQFLVLSAALLTAACTIGPAAGPRKPEVQMNDGRIVTCERLGVGGMTPGIPPGHLECTTKDGKVLRIKSPEEGHWILRGSEG